MNRQKRQRHPHTSRLSGNEIGMSWVHRIFILDKATASPGHWHSHSDIEIICRFSGKQGYEFKEHPDLVLQPRQALVIPARSCHQLANEIDAPGKRLCLFVRMPRQVASRDAVFTAKNLEYFVSRLLENAYRPISCDNDVMRCFNELADIVRRRTKGLEHWELATARVLACEALMRLATSRGRSQEDSGQLMAKAVKWLEERISTKVRMSDLVAFIGYGQSRFFQLFKQHTGHTPSDWLTRQRMARAERLLVETEDSAAAIGRAVGFPDAAYFIAVFRKFTGQTPTNYRKKFTRSKR